MKTRTQNVGHPKSRRGPHYVLCVTNQNMRILTMKAHDDPSDAQPDEIRRSVAEAGGMPPVKTILAALLWLSARSRMHPADPRALRALSRQLHRLAMHPDATAEDLAVGMRLASSADLDALDWLTLACLDPSAPSTTRH